MHLHRVLVPLLSSRTDSVLLLVASLRLAGLARSNTNSSASVAQGRTSLQSIFVGVGRGGQYDTEGFVECLVPILSKSHRASGSRLPQPGLSRQSPQPRLHRRRLGGGHSRGIAALGRARGRGLPTRKRRGAGAMACRFGPGALAGLFEHVVQTHVLVGVREGGGVVEDLDKFGGGHRSRFCWVVVLMFRIPPVGANAVCACHGCGSLWSVSTGCKDRESWNGYERSRSRLQSGHVSLFNAARDS